MPTFDLDIAKIVAKTKGKTDRVVRKIVLDIGRRLVERSPVGDPTWWRGSLVASGINGGSDIYSGMDAPEGYTGGHFRANWNHGIGEMPLTQFEDIDKTTSTSDKRIEASIKSSNAYAVHFIVNNLPYSIALENGHSWHQAPFGMVGLTVVEFGGIVREAAQEVNR